jgi:acyl transferase domain-containing protein
MIDRRALLPTASFESLALLPTASFESLNPAIQAGAKLQLLKKAVPWPMARKRRVCVSNFGKFYCFKFPCFTTLAVDVNADRYPGFGGANAAILLDEAHPPDLMPLTNSIAHAIGTGTYTNGNGHSKPGYGLYVFSSKSPSSLET